jgi:hypothetical protein
MNVKGARKGISEVIKMQKHGYIAFNTLLDRDVTSISSVLTLIIRLQNLGCTLHFQVMVEPIGVNRRSHNSRTQLGSALLSARRLHERLYAPFGSA